MLAELQRDRAETKAERSESRIRSIETELDTNQNSMKSLTVTGDSLAEKEDQISDQISQLKQRSVKRKMNTEASDNVTKFVCRSKQNLGQPTQQQNRCTSKCNPRFIRFSL